MENEKIGLVLLGGGARAAYQVGVLKGIGQILPRNHNNPFDVISGTSAGALNALSFASQDGLYRHRIRQLEERWSNLHSHHVFRSDVWGVFKNSLGILRSLINRGYSPAKPNALLDNTPLWSLVADLVNFDNLQRAIDQGELHAISVSTMSYATGQTVTFFQGDKNIQSWQRPRRVGVRATIRPQHLMASAAIPMAFPAVKINDHYFGDGAVRQLTPLSPALHLGAEKLVVIGVSDQELQQTPPPELHPPSIAQIMGQIYNSAFIDALDNDLRSLQAINRILRSQKLAQNAQSAKPIKTLVISPSRPIHNIAENYLHELPRSIKLFFGITGGNKRGGGTSAASYLLFEPGFSKALISLGYHDALKQEQEIRDFFKSKTQPNW